MAIIIKPSTFSAGTTILSAQVNANFDTIFSDYNGNIDSTNLDPAANIPDTMLAQITTGSKVSGAALTGTLITAKGVDIASATTTDIGAATGNLVDVTGTVTITGLGTIAAGAFRIVRFTGALLLTHNGTTLILPTGANITTAAGDVAGFESLGSGNWVCLFYQRKDGTSLTAATAAGNVVQVVNTNTGAVGTGSTTTPNDDTIPAITEGNEVLTTSYTPLSASNKLLFLISVTVNESTNTGAAVAVALHRATVTDALAVGTADATSYNGGSAPYPTAFNHYMTAPGTSTYTFSVRAGCDTGPVTWNGTASARKYGGVLISSLTIIEVKA